MPPISRRRVLRGALTAALAPAVASCAAPAPAGIKDAVGPGRGPHSADQAASHGATTAESVLQIVAHPDDDLYFMNPDLGHSLRSGRPLVTVYLTAGQSNGVNAPRTQALGPSRPRADKAAFAAARQNGIRAAYARMVTGDPSSPWRREVMPTAGGAEAQLDTLDAAPQIRLVWLQLHEAGSVGGHRPHSLRGLWDGEVAELRSLLAAGSPVAGDFSYTKEQLTRTLRGLLEQFRPTFVRMQDPTPDHRPGGQGWTDHQDHMYGARFVQQALARYTATAPVGRPRVATQVYLGYLNGSLPPSLGPAARRAKLQALRTYGWTDGRSCGDPAGCGDRKVGGPPIEHPGWVDSTRYHRGESTTWLQAEPDGSLRAFAVLDGRLAVWTRRAGNAARWSGPELLPGAGIDDGVTTVRLPDGRITVFATRTLLGSGPADYRRELVTTVQTAPGRSFGPWQSLGAPGRGAAAAGWEIGAPAAAVDGTGRLTVCLRDGTHGLSSRTRQADGSWRPWSELGGAGLLGPLAAVTDSAGRVHVLATTATTVLAWAQTRPGGAMTGPAATGLPATTGPLTAHREGTGIRLYLRRPGTAEVLTARRPEPGRPGAARLAGLGGPAGFGPVAAAAEGADVLLATRGDDGRPSWALLGAGGGPARRWTSTAGSGFLFAGAPASAPYDPRGRDGWYRGGTALTVIGLDARLYWAHTAAGHRPTPWQRA